MRSAAPLPYAPPQMDYTLLGSYVLSADFTVTLGGRSWTVPAGYRTDLATVPRIFWWAIPPTGAYEIAAVLHDWMITDGIAAGLVNSREADAVFRDDDIQPIFGVLRDRHGMKARDLLGRDIDDGFERHFEAVR